MDGMPGVLIPPGIISGKGKHRPGLIMSGRFYEGVGHLLTFYGMIGVTE